MLNYTIMPLDEAHLTEYCDDIARQLAGGAATMPLFNVTLTPEGDPAIDKAELCMQVYEKYKAELDARGLASGVLMQATIGHGWVLNQKSAFQKYLGLYDGRTVEVCCPLDEGFRRYIRAASRRIAETRPAHIMLDDDFRLMMRPGYGCACPLHMKRLSDLAGYLVTRESLLSALEDEKTPLRELFVKTQIDSLIECAREIRGGIDEIDPAIPGSFCACGNSVEGAYEIAEIMAGRGNPIVIRLNNANYCAADPRSLIGSSLVRAAAQRLALTGKPDVLLAETDTCPQNRYSTPAAKLHSHFTMTLLEGAAGAKHWITRLASFEPKSGEAYRKKLEKHRGFYEEIARIVPNVSWLGCRIPLPTHPLYPLRPSDPKNGKSIGWAGHVLDRMGFPMHFSPIGEGVSFFDGDADACFSDEEMREFLSGKVVFDAPAAMRVIARGFGEYLGVDVRERGTDAKNASGEIDRTSGLRLPAMYGMHEIVPIAEGVKEYSEVYHLRDGKYKDRLFSGVVGYENALGGRVAVFAGVTDFPYGLTSAFGFLNETRKGQIASVLSDMDALPLYYPGDAEAFLKCGRLPDGRLLCAFLDLSLDEIDGLPLKASGVVRSVERLLPSGEYAPVDFMEADGETVLDLTAYPYDPVVLVLDVRK